MTPCKRPWPVLFICCILGFNSFGIAYGTGAMFTDVMDTFGVSRATASLVQSVATGFMFGGGIFSGYFLQWRGPRTAVITGSVLATVGCVIAFLATHIVQVIVGIGVIAGCGSSFSSLVAVALPGTMFHDIRSLAMGISSASIAAGSAVYPMLLRHVTNHYSVRGTFLIMAAINCQIIVCGALLGLYTPPGSSPAGNTAESCKTIEVIEGNNDETVKDRAADHKEDIRLDEIDERNRLMPAEENEGPAPIQADAIAVDANKKSVMESESPISRSRLPQKLYAQPRSYDTHGEETKRLMPAESHKRESHPDSIPSVDELHEATAGEFADESQLRPQTLPSEKPDIKSSNSANRAGERIYRCCCSLHTVRKALYEPLKRFRNVRFLMLVMCLANACLYFPLPWMFMTDMVKSNNLSVEDGSFFITVLFVGNLTGRMSSGFLYKLLKSWIQMVSSLSMAAGGVSCLLFVFCENYVHFVIVSLFHGLAFGLAAATSLMSLLEITGPQRFGVHLGYYEFFVGTVFCLAGPYGGLIRDLTNSYEPLYYIALVHGLITGAVLLFTTLRYQRR